MSSHVNRNRGFSLLEVLVAMLVLGLALAGMIRVATENAAARSILSEQTLATWVAANAVESIRLLPAPPRAGVQTGQQVMGAQTWYWSMEISQTAVDSILRLDVTVYAEAGRQQAVAELSSFAGTGT